MNNKDRLESLKWREYDTYSIADKNFLEAMGVINGIWPEVYGWIFRYIMTWLFWSVLDYRRHDVSFWRQEGFHKANRGLIKYSLIAIGKDYVAICKNPWYKKLYKIPASIISLPFKWTVILLAYSAVESKSGREAYRACKAS
jgi:hypothetical protein